MSKEVSNIKGIIDKLETKQYSIIELYLDGEITDEQYLRLIDDINSQIKELKDLRRNK